MNYIIKQNSYLIFIILIGLFLFIPGQATRDFWGTSEARTAQIAQEMIDSGNWVIPSLNNEPRLTKPPLYFWTVALTAKFFNNNQVNELTARLPASLCAILTLIFLFLIVKKLFDEQTAFSASVMLATTYSFFWQSQQAMLDMMLVMFETAACLFFVYGLNAEVNRKKYFYLAMHSCLGLSVITKGPAGIIIPWIGIITYLIWTSRVRELKYFSWLTGFIVFSLAIAPWLIAVYLRMDSAFSIFYNETVTRYVSAFDHQREWHYFILRLPLYILPWGLFLPFLIWDIIKNKSLKDYKFPISFFLPAFIFFSLCQSKRSYYLVPLYPFIITSLALLFSKKVSFSLQKIKIVLLEKSYLLKLILGLSLGYILFIALFPILNNRFSAVDFCERITNELPQNHTLMSYKYSRPYLVYYLNRHIPSIESVEELKSKLLNVSDNDPVFVLMQEKDLLRMENVSYKLIFRYENFTKSDNTMVIITGKNYGGDV